MTSSASAAVALAVVLSVKLAVKLAVALSVKLAVTLSVVLSVKLAVVPAGTLALQYRYKISVWSQHLHKVLFLNYSRCASQSLTPRVFHQ